MKITRRQLRRIILNEVRRLNEDVDSDAAVLKEVFEAAIDLYFNAKETAKNSPLGDMWASAEGFAKKGLDLAIETALKNIEPKPPDVIINMVVGMMGKALEDRETAKTAAGLLAKILAEGKEQMQTEKGREAIKKQLEGMLKSED